MGWERFSIQIDIQASSLLCCYGFVYVGEYIGIVFLVAVWLGLFVGMEKEELGEGGFVIDVCTALFTLCGYEGLSFAACLSNWLCVAKDRVGLYFMLLRGYRAFVTYVLSLQTRASVWRTWERLESQVRCLYASLLP